MNWNVVFAHAWPDKLYDLALVYLKNNRDVPSNTDLPEWTIKSLRNRMEVGYVLSSTDPDLIVLHVNQSVLPWCHYKNKYIGNRPINITFTFSVIRESNRYEILNIYLKDPSKNALNPETLMKRIFQDGFLGMSRRYISTQLITNPSNVILNMKPSKPVIKAFKPKYPYEHWQMDLIDLMAISSHNRGYKYILVIVDIFSKFVYLFPMKNKEALTVSIILKRIFLTGEIPTILHSDGGGEFKKDVVSVCDSFHVKLIKGKGYSPQTQGFVEKKNHYIKRLIQYHFQVFKTQTYFDILDQISFTINNTMHAITKLTPMQLHKGRLIPVSKINVDESEEYLDSGNISILLPSDEDMITYFNENVYVHDEAITNVRKTLKTQAEKQDKKYITQKAPIKQGFYVKVLAYTISGNSVHPIILRGIPSPLTKGSEKVVDSVRALQISEFKKTMLPRFKVYTTQFKVHQVITSENKQKQFILKDEQGGILERMESSVNGSQWNKHFYNSHLIVDYGIHKSEDITRPVYTFIDLDQHPPLHGGSNNTSSSTIDVVSRRRPSSVPTTTTQPSTLVPQTPQPSRTTIPSKIGGVTITSNSDANYMRSNNNNYRYILKPTVYSRKNLLHKNDMHNILKHASWINRSHILYAWPAVDEGDVFTGGVLVYKGIIQSKSPPSDSKGKSFITVFDNGSVPNYNVRFDVGETYRIYLNPEMYGWGDMDSKHGWVFEDENQIIKKQQQYHHLHHQPQ